MHCLCQHSLLTARRCLHVQELPAQDLGAETYGCWGNGYMQNGCPQKFMDGQVRPTGANGTGPYVVSHARSLLRPTQPAAPLYLRINPTVSAPQCPCLQAYMQPARSLRQQTHAATIIALPNGDMLAAWFDGVEGMAGVGIVVSR